VIEGNTGWAGGVDFSTGSTIFGGTGFWEADGGAAGGEAIGGVAVGGEPGVAGAEGGTLVEPVVFTASFAACCCRVCIGCFEGEASPSPGNRNRISHMPNSTGSSPFHTRLLWTTIQPRMFHSAWVSIQSCGPSFRRSTAAHQVVPETIFQSSGNECTSEPQLAPAR
jgi:hypothetical protein